jgi:hypothetical protein
MGMRTTFTIVAFASVALLTPLTAQQVQTDADNILAGTAAASYVINRIVPLEFRKLTLVNSNGSESAPAYPKSIEIGAALSLRTENARDRLVCSPTNKLVCYLDVGDARVITVHSVNRDGSKATVIISVAQTYRRQPSEMYPNPMPTTHQETFQVLLTRSDKGWNVVDFRSLAVS